MSNVIECDECKQKFYTDSRSHKASYVPINIDDPIFGFSTIHLCRKCYIDKFPWLNSEWTDEDQKDLDIYNKIYNKED